MHRVNFMMYTSGRAGCVMQIWKQPENETTCMVTVSAQRKNLIDLGHDLGNRDQDKVDPGQESRS